MLEAYFAEYEYSYYRVFPWLRLTRMQVVVNSFRVSMAVHCLTVDLSVRPSRSIWMLTICVPLLRVSCRLLPLVLFRLLLMTISEGCGLVLEVLKGLVNGLCGLAVVRTGSSLLVLVVRVTCLDVAWMVLVTCWDV